MRRGPLLPAPPGRTALREPRRQAHLRLQPKQAGEPQTRAARGPRRHRGHHDQPPGHAGTGPPGNRGGSLGEQPAPPGPSGGVPARGPRGARHHHHPPGDRHGRSPQNRRDRRDHLGHQPGHPGTRPASPGRQGTGLAVRRDDPHGPQPRREAASQGEGPHPGVARSSRPTTGAWPPGQVPLAAEGALASCWWEYPEDWGQPSQGERLEATASTEHPGKCNPAR